jgi:regulator of cell morphogenesis and NO signaling
VILIKCKPYIYMKLFTLNTTVAEVICKYPQLIFVLERLNIPLGVKEKSIEEISKEYKINPNLIVVFFNLQVYKLIASENQFSNEDAGAIIDFLKSSHDYYSHDFYPEISVLINQMIQYNEKQSEFKMLQVFFNDYLNEVEQHFTYENEVVFPYVKSLITGNLQKTNYSVEEYKQHHDDIEAKLSDLKSLLVKFLPPEGDTRIRRKIIMALTQLDEDLQVHARIENEILIPLVEKMEQSKDE